MLSRIHIKIIQVKSVLANSYIGYRTSLQRRRRTIPLTIAMFIVMVILILY